MMRFICFLFVLLNLVGVSSAKEISPALLNSFYYLDSAEVYKSNTKVDSVFYFIIEELAKAKQLNTNFAYKVLQKKANYLEAKDKHDAAILILLDLKVEINKEDIPDVLYMVNLDLALIYEKIGSYEKCFSYLQEANQIHKNFQLDSIYSNYCVRLASYYRFQSEIDSSLKYARLALENTDPTDFYKVADANLILGITLSSINQPTAIYHYQKAIQAFRVLGDQVSVGFMFLNIAGIYFRQDDIIRSTVNLDTAFAIWQTTGDSMLAESVYSLKMKMFASIGQFDSAYHYSLLYNSFNFSNNSRLRQAEIAEIENYFLEREQEKIIQEQIARSKIQQWRLYGALAISALFLSLLLYSLKLNKNLKAKSLLADNQAKSLMDANSKLNKSLKKQEILLSEIHHRVNNNLQIVSNILDFHAESIEDLQVREFTSKAQSRIKAMTFIHSTLYNTKDFDSVNADAYIRCLASAMEDLYKIDKKEIEYLIDVADISLHIDQAIPLGLILVELVSNSYKHAFNGRKNGEIHIKMRLKENRVQFSISDNGIGLPPKFDVAKLKSMGFEIVLGLTRQINGKLEIVNNGSTKFVIRFKKKID